MDGERIVGQAVMIGHQYKSYDIVTRYVGEWDENTTVDAKLRYGEVDTSSIQFNAVCSSIFEAVLGIPTLYEDVNDHNFGM